MTISILFGVLFAAAFATALYGVLARSGVMVALLLLQLGVAIALRVLLY